MKTKIHRHILVSLLMLAIFILPETLSAKDIFESLAKDFGQSVESTYVSGRFSHSGKTWWSRDGRNYFNLNRGFSSMYVYNLNSEESVRAAEKLQKKHIDSHPRMELMLTKQTGHSVYKIYEEIGEDNKIYQLIIWNRLAPNCAELVVVNWKNGLGREKHDSDFLSLSGDFFDMQTANEDIYNYLLEKDFGELSDISL